MVRNQSKINSEDQFRDSDLILVVIQVFSRASPEKPDPERKVYLIIKLGDKKLRDKLEFNVATGCQPQRGSTPLSSPIPGYFSAAIDLIRPIPLHFPVLFAPRGKVNIPPKIIFSSEEKKRWIESFFKHSTM